MLCKFCKAPFESSIKFLKLNYSAWGAATGQASAQAPHSMQASASITYLPSPSEIASTGHSAAHAPQEMQSSLMMYAIVTVLLIIFSTSLYHNIQKMQEVFNVKYILCPKNQPSISFKASISSLLTFILASRTVFVSFLEKYFGGASGLL